LPRPVASLPGALACEAHAGDRIAGRSFAMRSQVIAQHGIGATSHPLATQVGLDVLKAVGTGPTRRSAAWSRCRIDIGGRGVFHKGRIAHLSGDCLGQRRCPVVRLPRRAPRRMGRTDPAQRPRL